MGVLTQDRKEEILALTLEAWQTFCEFSIQSDYYRLALERTDNMEEAAALSVFRNFLSVFPQDQIQRFESDPEFFHSAAVHFLKEMSPFRYKSTSYDAGMRRSGLHSIRGLLKGLKESSSQKSYRTEKYFFYKSIIKCCSSLDFIIRTYDLHKRFAFRELPQVRAQMPPSRFASAEMLTMV